MLVSLSDLPTLCISCQRESNEVAFAQRVLEKKSVAQEGTKKENNNIRNEIKEAIRVVASRHGFPAVQVTVHWELLDSTLQEFDDHQYETETDSEEEDIDLIEKTLKKSRILKWFFAFVVGVMILCKFIFSATADNTGHCLAITDH